MCDCHQHTVEFNLDGQNYRALIRAEIGPLLTNFGDNIPSNLTDLVKYNIMTCMLDFALRSNASNADLITNLFGGQLNLAGWVVILRIPPLLSNALAALRYIALPYVAPTDPDGFQLGADRVEYGSDSDDVER